MKKVKREGVDKFLILKDYMLLENYLITTDQIKDIDDSPMGFFIFFFEKSNLEKHVLDNLNQEYFQAIIIILIVLTLISFYLISKNYTKQLTKDVKNKTLELKRQQKDMESLLEVYDKHVIFSKTDPKGIITQVSDAFCKISGFSKNELIGKHHNIVRHPDMLHMTEYPDTVVVSVRTV